MWDNELRKASTVWPERVLPLASVIVPEIITSIVIFRSSSESNTNSNNALASSTDCDQFIKDYETFVDGYVKILKKYKINQTDPTILNEYTEVLQKATEMQTNAANCSDPKYSSKLMALATKMTKAAAELQ